MKKAVKVYRIKGLSVSLLRSRIFAHGTLNRWSVLVSSGQGAREFLTCNKIEAEKLYKKTVEAFRALMLADAAYWE